MSLETFPKTTDKDPLDTSTAVEKRRRVQCPQDGEASESREGNSHGICALQTDLTLFVAQQIPRLHRRTI